MQFPITVGLHRSRFLAAILLLVHGLAIAGTLLTSWPPAMRAFLSLFWLISLFHALRRSELCLKALHLSADGRCSVVRNLGEAPEPSALLPGLYVHPWLTVLRLQTGDGAVIPVVVLPDVMAADDRRHLRLWLRHKAKIGEDGDV